MAQRGSRLFHPYLSQGRFNYNNGAPSSASSEALRVDARQTMSLATSEDDDGMVLPVQQTHLHHVLLFLIVVAALINMAWLAASTSSVPLYVWCPMMVANVALVVAYKLLLNAGRVLMIAVAALQPLLAAKWVGEAMVVGSGSTHMLFLVAEVLRSTARVEGLSVSLMRGSIDTTTTSGRLQVSAVKTQAPLRMLVVLLAVGVASPIVAVALYVPHLERGLLALFASFLQLVIPAAVLVYRDKHSALPAYAYTSATEAHEACCTLHTAAMVFSNSNGPGSKYNPEHAQEDEIPLSNANSVVSDLLDPAARGVRQVAGQLGTAFAKYVGLVAWNPAVVVCIQFPEVNTWDGIREHPTRLLHFAHVMMHRIAKTNGFHQTRSLGDEIMVFKALHNPSLGMVDGETEDMGEDGARSTLCISGLTLASALQRRLKPFDVSLKAGVGVGHCTSGVFYTNVCGLDVMGEAVTLARKLCKHAKPGRIALQAGMNNTLVRQSRIPAGPRLPQSTRSLHSTDDTERAVLVSATDLTMLLEEEDLSEDDDNCDMISVASFNTSQTFAYRRASTPRNMRESVSERGGANELESLSACADADRPGHLTAMPSVSDCDSNILNAADRITSPQSDTGLSRAWKRSGSLVRSPGTACQAGRVFPPVAYPVTAIPRSIYSDFCLAPGAKNHEVLELLATIRWIARTRGVMQEVVAQCKEIWGQDPNARSRLVRDDCNMLVGTISIDKHLWEGVDVDQQQLRKVAPIDGRCYPLWGFPARIGAASAMSAAVGHLFAAVGSAVLLGLASLDMLFHILPVLCVLSLFLGGAALRFFVLGLRQPDCPTPTDSAETSSHVGEMQDSVSLKTPSEASDPDVGEEPERSEVAEEEGDKRALSHYTLLMIGTHSLSLPLLITCYGLLTAEYVEHDDREGIDVVAMLAAMILAYPIMLLSLSFHPLLRTVAIASMLGTVSIITSPVHLLLAPPVLLTPLLLEHLEATTHRLREQITQQGAIVTAARGMLKEVHRCCTPPYFRVHSMLSSSPLVHGSPYGGTCLAIEIHASFLPFRSSHLSTVWHDMMSIMVQIEEILSKHDMVFTQVGGGMILAAAGLSGGRGFVEQASSAALKATSVFTSVNRVRTVARGLSFSPLSFTMGIHSGSVGFSSVTPHPVVMYGIYGTAVAGALEMNSLANTNTIQLTEASASMLKAPVEQSESDHNYLNLMRGLRALKKAAYKKMFTLKKREVRRVGGEAVTVYVLAGQAQSTRHSRARSTDLSSSFEAKRSRRDLREVDDFDLNPPSFLESRAHRALLDTRQTTTIPAMVVAAAVLVLGSCSTPLLCKESSTSFAHPSSPHQPST
eukprot:Sspe_Gene.73650::Locus_44645_Transcript_1_1_Confidence_1.000_Length_4375::g.73650::m.73650